MVHLTANDIIFLLQSEKLVDKFRSRLKRPNRGMAEAETLSKIISDRMDIYSKKLFIFGLD